MAPVSGAPLQWVMVGLVTGAEVFGHLPRTAAGRFADYLNSDLGDVLPIGRASTEDVDNGTEVPELVVWLRHITYIQPWSSGDAGAQESATQNNRGSVPVELVLRTRIRIGGMARIPSGVDLNGWLARPTEQFIGLGQAVLGTPTGQKRPADGVLVNKEHIMLARRTGS
jgi:hypothetical protein